MYRVRFEYLQPYEAKHISCSVDCIDGINNSSSNEGFLRRQNRATGRGKKEIFDNLGQLLTYQLSYLFFGYTSPHLSKYLIN